MPLGFATKLYSDEYETGGCAPPTRCRREECPGLDYRRIVTRAVWPERGPRPCHCRALAPARPLRPLTRRPVSSIRCPRCPDFDNGTRTGEFWLTADAIEQFPLDGGNALSHFRRVALASIRASPCAPNCHARSVAGFRHPFLLSPYIFAAGGFGNIVMPTAVERGDIGAGSAGVGMRTDSGVPGLFGGTLALEFARKFSDVPTVHAGYRGNVSLSLRF